MAVVDKFMSLPYSYYYEMVFYMDSQSILLLILLLLSINLIIVGFYVVIVLRDIRRLIKSVQEFSDEAKGAIKGVSGSIVSLPLIAKTIFQVYKSVKKDEK